ncbi:MAG: hypothetical protein IPJ74_05795 [Saprospiraceae bacterium]|nr:hypothetical protein [Saprospiraceae bacterium]
MKKQTGIWLDSREAFVVQLNKNDAVVLHIESDIENFNVVGGCRSKTLWGPQESVSESKYLGRRQHQEKNYFESLMDAVKDADELYVCGPAEAKIGLTKAIEASTTFHPNLLGVETIDSMSQNQIVAHIKAFFNAVGNEN